MNFQISGYRTTLTKIFFIIKSGSVILPEKAWDVNNMRQHLTDVRVQVEHSIIDDGIDQ